MNAQTIMQRMSPLGPARAVSTPILIRIEVLGDVCVLHIKGHLHAGADTDYLNTKMDEIKILACTKFLANCEDIVSLGSAGLSFFIGLYKTSCGHLVLVKTQPRVREVLDITRLNTLIPLAADIDSGLAALRVGTHQCAGPSRCEA